MPTATTRLGLSKPLGADNFSVTDFQQNYDKIDAAPGITICTSGTRPGGWGANQNGMVILETDTGLMWRWDGTKFVRVSAKGHLAEVSSNSPAATNSNAFSATTVLTAANVAVPAQEAAGPRRIRITISWMSLSGSAKFFMFRDAVVIGERWMGNLKFAGAGQPSAADGGSMVFYDNPGVGTYSYIWKYALTPAPDNSWGCTSTTLNAAAASPLRMDIEEV